MIGYLKGKGGTDGQMKSPLSDHTQTYRHTCSHRYTHTPDGLVSEPAGVALVEAVLEGGVQLLRGSDGGPG